MSWSKEYHLRVGEVARVKKSFFGTSYAVIYAGMPSEKVYSIVITSASGYHNSAYNIFLPLDQTSIHLEFGLLNVKNVTADRIRLMYST